MLQVHRRSVLLGEPKAAKANPSISAFPASSIDADNDTVYHEGIVSSVVKKLGYTPHSMNEAHAIVYSELAEHDFTGIGVSCGGGMFNVCVAYKTIPAVKFSVVRGGDWIDQHVSRVMGISRTRAAAIKEGDVNLMAPRSREEEAVVLYYRNLISYVLQNLKQRFQLARDVPQFEDPVEVVVAGGTSLVGGFVEVFAEELQKVDFPLQDRGSPSRRGCDHLGGARLSHRRGPGRKLTVQPAEPRFLKAEGLQTSPSSFPFPSRGRYA